MQQETVLDKLMIGFREKDCPFCSIDMWYYIKQNNRMVNLEVKYKGLTTLLLKWLKLSDFIKNIWYYRWVRITYYTRGIRMLLEELTRLLEIHEIEPRVYDEKKTGNGKFLNIHVDREEDKPRIIIPKDMELSEFYIALKEAHILEEIYLELKQNNVIKAEVNILNVPQYIFGMFVLYHELHHCQNPPESENITENKKEWEFVCADNEKLEAHIKTNYKELNVFLEKEYRDTTDKYIQNINFKDQRGFVCDSGETVMAFIKNEYKKLNRLTKEECANSIRSYIEKLVLDSKMGNVQYSLMCRGIEAIIKDLYSKVAVRYSEYEKFIQEEIDKLFQTNDGLREYTDLRVGTSGYKKWYNKSIIPIFRKYSSKLYAINMLNGILYRLVPRETLADYYACQQINKTIRKVSHQLKCEKDLNLFVNYEGELD